MTSGQERRKHARSAQTAGYVSRYAQQRVDKRVIEIMSRRDAAERRDFPQIKRCRRGASRGAPSRAPASSRVAARLRAGLVAPATALHKNVERSRLPVYDTIGRWLRCVSRDIDSDPAARSGPPGPLGASWRGGGPGGLLCHPATYKTPQRPGSWILSAVDACWASA
jgi:hypothetical protein